MNAAAKALLPNYEYYESILPDLVKDHYGKIVLLHNSQAVAFFDNELQAYEYGCKTYGLGNFIYQQCLPLGEQRTCIISTPRLFY